MQTPRDVLIPADLWGASRPGAVPTAPEVARIVRDLRAGGYYLAASRRVTGGFPLYAPPGSGWRRSLDPRTFRRGLLPREVRTLLPELVDEHERRVWEENVRAGILDAINPSTDLWRERVEQLRREVLEWS